MKKNIMAVILILVLAAAFALCGCSADTADKDADESGGLPAIIIGSDDYPPYNYAAADGKPIGIDVDLATEAFRRIGYKAVFQNINWEKKKELVESGEIDCIWGSFSINGREKDYKWTEPYMYSYQVVAVKKDSNIVKLSDLKGKRIAVQTTSKPESIFLSKSNPQIPEVDEVVSAPDQELLYAQLSKGYVDAIASHKVALMQGMSDYGIDFRILDEPIMTVGLGVAFSQYDKRGLEDKLSKAFEEMRSDGTMEEIIGKYLEEPRRYMGGVMEDEEKSFN